MHVVDESLLANPVELITLADMVLFDLAHGLDSRVLALNPHDITYAHGIPQLHGLLLLDHGIFSDLTGLYRIILSDIAPFTRSIDFNIFQFQQADVQEVYYHLRNNFYRGWFGNSGRHRTIYLPEFLEMILLIANNASLTSLPELLFFKHLYANNQNSLKFLKEAKKKIEDMLNSSGLRSKSLPYDELRFAQWFDTSAETDSLGALKCNENLLQPAREHG